MKTVLVTGSQGFIGKNLVEALSRQGGIKITSFTADDNITTLKSLLEDEDVDIIIPKISFGLFEKL